MYARIELHITKDFYVTGKAVYSHFYRKESNMICNSSYHLSFIKGELIDKENLSPVFQKLTIKNQGIIEILFQGKIVVPQKTSQVKNEYYIEADGIQSGIIPLFIEPFIRGNFEINVQIPQEYSIVGFQQVDETHYQKCVSESFDTGFVIFEESKIQIYQYEQVTVYAGWYHSFDDVKQMAQIAFKIHQTYTNMFSSSLYEQLHLVLNPRFDNGAYLRNDTIYLVDRIEGLNQETFYHLAHEISHLWWQNSDLTRTNDWINETFAQYSALLLVKEQYGIKAYQDIINEYKEKTKDLPSLSKINEKTPRQISFPVHYYKGPYLFHMLECQIGQEKMLRIFKQSYQMKIKTGQEFMKLVPEFKEFYFLS